MCVCVCVILGATDGLNACHVVGHSCTFCVLLIWFCKCFQRCSLNRQTLLANPLSSCLVVQADAMYLDLFGAMGATSREWASCPSPTSHLITGRPERRVLLRKKCDLGAELRKTSTAWGFPTIVTQFHGFPFLVAHRRGCTL